MIGFLVAGLIVGGLARLIKPGKQSLSLPMTLLVGIVGSLVGGTIAWVLGTGSIWELDALGFIASVIVGVLFLGVAEGMASKRS